MPSKPIKKMNGFKEVYAYDLPEELIASEPVYPRHTSRMLILDQQNGAVQHNHFLNLPSLLEKGSILVVNNSKVIPARLPGKRKTGGVIEVLLVKEQAVGIWQCKVKNSAKIKPGEMLSLCENQISAEFLSKDAKGECLLKFDHPETLFESLEKHAYAPLPPYIQKVRKKEHLRDQDLENYQTVFASQYGAIAAPTAGLHFSDSVIEEIRQNDIEILEITLHVGLGTFEPIRVQNIEDHQMHEEAYEITSEVAKRLNQVKKEGRKIVSVGTTATRTLESAWKNGEIRDGRRQTDIFIYPPYRFNVVNQLITNFHLPESTLMMLVSALAGKDNIMNAYHQAIERKYRFFSYGDCMFIR